MFGSGHSDLLQRIRTESVVSGTDARGGEVFEFTWDGVQSIFASGLADPSDLTFDSAGNLFVVDYEVVNHDAAQLFGIAAIYKITPNGAQTIFASGVSYHSYRGR